MQGLLQSGVKNFNSSVKIFNTSVNMVKMRCLVLSVKKINT
jgi:hypothetical protein